MRGDRPAGRAHSPGGHKFTPHARGSTMCLELGFTGVGVYPACAGIDLRWLYSTTRKQCLPRMRGDRPLSRSSSQITVMFTPHARGSTAHPREVLLCPGVYPACAGIDLVMRGSCSPHTCLPRMRGDRPSRPPRRQKCPRFTPHARGSTFV